MSEKNNTEIIIDEDKATSAFEEHSNYVVQGSQLISVDQKESVSISTRFTALINATDEAKLKGIKKLDEVMMILQNGQIDSASSSGPLFSNSTNLPSHKNIDQQRFHSTKKKNSKFQIADYQNQQKYKNYQL